MRLLCFLSLLLILCQPATAQQAYQYPTIDYLTVGKIASTLGPPYIIDLRKDEKQLVLIGCSHTRDTTSKEFDVIALYFQSLQPQIAFNEGGQVPDSIHYNNRNESIVDKGETGFLKYLCDQQGIRMMNGDFTESDEFPVMLTRHPKEEVQLYYTIERFIWPYMNGFEGDIPLEEAYDNFIHHYLTKNEFPLTDEEKTFDYFKKLYQKHIGKAFDVATVDIEKFDFTTDNGKFCEIGRTSKEIRDDVLLSKIEEAFNQYDRIFVTFGGAHAIAIEPALRQMMNKER